MKLSTAAVLSVLTCTSAAGAPDPATVWSPAALLHEPPGPFENADEASAYREMLDIDFVVGLFFATVQTGFIHVSSDGMNWTRSELADADATLDHIQYDPAHEVFGAVAGGKLLMSNDGIQWQATTSIAGEVLSLAIGDGTWVALANDGGLSTWASSDLQDWQSAPAPEVPPSTGMERIVSFADGRFINASYTSDDGLTWTYDESAHANITAGSPLEGLHNDTRFVSPFGAAPVYFRDIFLEVPFYSSHDRNSAQAKGVAVSDAVAVRSITQTRSSVVPGAYTQSATARTWRFGTGGSPEVSDIVFSHYSDAGPGIPVTGTEYEFEPESLAYGAGRFAVTGARRLRHEWLPDNTLQTYPAEGFVELLNQETYAPHSVATVSNYAEAALACERLLDVAYGNGLFVAIDSEGVAWVSQAVEEEHPFWGTAWLYGNSWKQLPKWGWIWDGYANWTYHVNVGWLWHGDTPAQGMFIDIDGLGWVYSTPDVFPWVKWGSGPDDWYLLDLSTFAPNLRLWFFTDAGGWQYIDQQDL